VNVVYIALTLSV